MDVPELWTAILSGQYYLANQMISRGANVNEYTRTEGDPMTTLLHYAVLTSDVRCIHVLANLGANFNARDSRNFTPLHWAVKYNVGPDVVEVLVNEGTVVNATDHDQFTPLHYAALKDNNTELIQKLIAKGASIDAVGSKGRSVLHVAIMCHNLEMVKILISHRVNIDPKDIFGRTPLFLYLSIKSYLLEYWNEKPKMEMVSVFPEHIQVFLIVSRAGKYISVLL